MPISLSEPSSYFVGRDEYISRFKARLEHFRFFIYEGIAGIGKTALLLRLASEAKAIGAERILYINLNPGEGIHSIVARVESRFREGTVTAYDVQGDAYARLVGALHARKAVLLLDGLHYLRADELPTLARVLQAKEGDYRVVATITGDPGLSAMDRMALHHERLGGLTRKDVKIIAERHKVGGEALEAIVSDTTRGGSCAHPLTLRYLLALRGSDVPPKSFLSKHSARSTTAFRAVMDLWGERLSAEEKRALEGLARVGVPVGLDAARQAFGAAVDTLVARGLIDIIDGDLHIHLLVTQYLGTDAAISESAAKTVATHLKERAITLSEPMAVIRAGEILAHAGAAETAVEMLASGWEAIRDLDFLVAYLKTLASIPADDSLKPRLKVLAARARMRQGAPSNALVAEMESLAEEQDPRTRFRALAALTYIHCQRGDDQNALAAFEALHEATDDGELFLPAGSLAATAMMRVGRIAQAEKLSKTLLSKLKGQKQHEREGELHRLLARIYGQGGRLEQAVKEAEAAVACFDAAGDLYHAATSQGFIGDMYREAGEFEQAKEAFKKFRDIAVQCGDRDLIHIADLADAWVSLDIGDLTRAAKQIEAVESDMNVAPSGRLKRYLAAARALLEAGRGRHEVAAEALDAVVRTWIKAGQVHVADHLRAQQVRSLIACDKIDEAQELIDAALKGLDEKVAAPRVAAFLRESALIRLRRKEVAQAIEELTRARQLFAKGGNRREEALTLHRIARAAVEEGDLELGASSANEALELARKIKHARAIALAREVQGRIALLNDDAKEATAACKEALQNLKKLGDELGALHVGEALMRALIVSGDLANALRLGPKIREEAERLDVREVRVRSIILMGVALLRRGRVDAAGKCFKELPERAFSPWTRALMWRFGEALASVEGDRETVLERRDRWVMALRKLPGDKQVWSLRGLEQLALPPRDRCQLRTSKKSAEVLGTEQLGWFEPDGYDVVVDLLNHRVWEGERSILLDDVPDEARTLLAALVVAAPEGVPYDAACKAMYGDDDKADKRVKAAVKLLQKAIKDSKRLEFVADVKEVKLVAAKAYGFLIPTWLTSQELTREQRQVVGLLGQYGAASLQTIQDMCELNKTTARREITALVDAGLVETVRDGRGQAYRLA